MPQTTEQPFDVKNAAPTVALGRGLNQVDEVAASVLKQHSGDWPHTLWFPTDKPLPTALVKKLVKARVAQNERKKQR